MRNFLNRHLRTDLLVGKSPGTQIPDSSLNLACSLDALDGLKERLLFVFWTGSNDLTPNRLRSLRALRRQRGISVIFITPETLSSWLLADSELHPAYSLLTNNHRSDYLRSYFMWHYGGGYSDLKPLRVQLGKYFDALSYMDVDFLGYPETDPGHIAGDEHMRRNFHSFCGNGLFIFRKKSEFAKVWFARVTELLDHALPALEKAHRELFLPREYVFPQCPDHYPLRWAEVQGEIFHELQSLLPNSYAGILPDVLRLFGGKRYR